MTETESGPKFSETYAFRKGAKVENKVEDALKRRSWAVLPVRLWNREGAPAFETLSDSIVLPDLLAARSGETHFVEVKAKKSAVEYHKKNQLRHGVPSRLYYQYQYVAARSGLPVHLAFYEQDTGLLFAANVLETDPVQHLEAGRSSKFGEDMTFFARETLTHVGVGNKSGEKILLNGQFPLNY